MVQSQRPLFKRLVDLFFGFDFFVSYSHGDGWKYAEALTRELEALNFDVFLDRDDFHDGVNWKSAGGWSLRRTSKLILVGTPDSLGSKPVQYELEVFAETGRTVIPISIDGALSKLSDEHPFRKHLGDETLRIEELDGQRLKGPSAATVGRIAQSFNILRQDQKRTRWLQALVVIFALISGIAVWQSVEAGRAQGVAERARQQASEERDDAVRARNNARNANMAAQSEAARARKAEDEAKESAFIALQRRREAEEQTRLALAARNAEILARQQERESTALIFANLALSQANSDPTLALQLAKRAQSSSPTREAEIAALIAYNSGSMLRTLELPEIGFAQFLGDGSRIIVIQGRDAAIFSASNGERLGIIPDLDDVVPFENGGMLARRANQAGGAGWWLLDSNGEVVSSRLAPRSAQSKRCGANSSLLVTYSEYTEGAPDEILLIESHSEESFGVKSISPELPEKNVSCFNDRVLLTPDWGQGDSLELWDFDGLHKNLQAPKIPGSFHHYAVADSGSRVVAQYSRTDDLEDILLAVYDIDPNASNSLVLPRLLTGSEFHTNPFCSAGDGCEGDTHDETEVKGIYLQDDANLIVFGETRPGRWATRFRISDMYADHALGGDLESDLFSVEISTEGILLWLRDSKRTIWLDHDLVWQGLMLDGAFDGLRPNYYPSLRAGAVLSPTARGGQTRLWTKPEGIEMSVYRGVFNPPNSGLSRESIELESHVLRSRNGSHEPVAEVCEPESPNYLIESYRVCVKFGSWEGTLGTGLERISAYNLAELLDTSASNDQSRSPVVEIRGEDEGGNQAVRRFVLDPRWILEVATPSIQTADGTGSTIRDKQEAETE